MTTAVRAVADHEPDVVLMDVRMPGIDGIEATRRIRERAPGCRVLILTMHDDDTTVFTAMKAGAQGYLLKEAEQDDIVRAVHAVVAGEAIFGPGCRDAGARLLRGAPGAGRVRGAVPRADRSRADRSSICWPRAGATPRSQSEPYLSTKTVSNHLTSIFAKLQVAGRGEAIVRAREGGLGTSK